ncbi:MAG: hypothetical protein QOG14_2877 [Mycobacterium sp.]|jgi:hypothetical protein|nr:hypothetical protein [Mycobacterium sp.]
MDEYASSRKWPRVLWFAVGVLGGVAGLTLAGAGQPLIGGVLVAAAGLCLVWAGLLEFRARRPAP